MGLVVAHTVVPGKNGCTVVRLLNPTAQELKLCPGSHLGVFHHVKECDILTPAKVFDSRQVDAPLPDLADLPANNTGCGPCCLGPQGSQTPAWHTFGSSPCL